MADRLSAAKAWVAAGFGLLAPGAAYVAAAAQDGMTGNEWIIAAALCVGGAGTAGYAVYRTENKPKPTGGAVPPSSYMTRDGHWQ